jgi:D-alanyl-D-alanine carboxypeptidase (penicillin-binding protein 5/6)
VEHLRLTRVVTAKYGCDSWCPLDPHDAKAKLIHILLVAALSSACSGMSSAQGVQTSVPHAILMDFDTQSVLFEKDADAPVIPASTVKIMSAEVVFNELKLGHLKLDDTFRISETAWRLGGALSRGSSMFASVNSRVRIEDLIRGLVIVSGNDAAIALAEGISGSESAFAEKMTKRALELGMNRSNFTNSWGRSDPDQKVTPRDMAILAKFVIRTYPEYYKFFAEKEFTWNKIKQSNRNPLLNMNIGADGLKTGNIDASGFGLVGSAVENGQRLILAIYGAQSPKERASEALKLLLWGFRSFELRTLFKARESVGDAKVFGGNKAQVALVAQNDVQVLIPRATTERLAGRIVYLGPLVAPVEQGSKVGRLEIIRGSSVILDVPLITAASAEIGSLPQRAVDAGSEYAGTLIRSIFAKP